MIIDQKILPLKALPQPQPSIYEGGDCGACVLGGLLPPDYHNVPAVYEVCREDLEAFSHSTMTDSLFNAKAHGLIEDFIYTVPIWPHPGAYMMWGSTGWSMSGEWFDYIKVAILAGYYALAPVDAFGKGIDVDHWVMIKGYRIREIPIKGNKAAKRISKDILVSDSSVQRPDLKWIQASTFLKKHGGYNAILVRPKQPNNEVKR